jgi:hypothetical protein
VEVDPVGAAAGTHLTGAETDSVHECPHAFDALATCAPGAVMMVEQIHGLAERKVAHDMHLGDEERPVVGQCWGVLQVLRKRLELLPHVDRELAVNVVRVYNGNAAVKGPKRLKQ